MTDAPHRDDDARTGGGRFRRGWRWLPSSRRGPIPRLRRTVGVLRRAASGREPLRRLPEALATALLAPVRWPSESSPPPPRDWSPERAAARERWRAFAARVAKTRPCVALVADGDALDGYRSEWDLVAIRPEDWATVLRDAIPDLVVVESARNGNGGAWAYRIAWTGHPDFFLQRDLVALCAWAAAESILTIFRVRERGPVAVRRWRDAARHFDLIVAADAEAAAGYAAIGDRRGNVGPVVSAAASGGELLDAIRAAA